MRGGKTHNADYPRNPEGTIIMKAFKTTILVTGLAALAGCANWDKSPICDPSHQWTAWSDVRCNVSSAPKDVGADVSALERDRQRLADELAAARKQNSGLSSRVSDLERQLADRDREIATLHSRVGELERQIAAAKQRNADLEAQLAAMGGMAGDKNKLAAELAAARQRIADLEKQLADCEARLADLRSQLDQSKGSLAKAEKDLIKALQPEISKGTVSVHQSGDALTINLASSLLFDSGKDQLKAGGTDALKRVGNVLKDFPEKQVHVAGYTDNVAIKGALLKKFPSNKELSDARATSAAQALRDGGVSSNLSDAGHGDSNPIASNNTADGRAKNRRVEVIVK
jgi:chemotaxis protein MotB